MPKKILLLGNSGKMGIALTDILSKDYIVQGRNSKDFDAAQLKQVATLINAEEPNIVINAVAFLGIDPCENDPIKALRLNTLYPKFLAELSEEKKYLLIHFSTDGVFNDRKEGFFIESDAPSPMHIYGLTKYGGDCFIQAIAKHYYIIRIPILFGETNKKTQFVEKMLDKIESGQKILKIADDIVYSPSYSRDIALKVKQILDNELPGGLYHVVNEGKASLYELMKEIVVNLKLDVSVEKASYKDFPSVGIKNTFTPMSSEKIGVMRPWRDAVYEYCKNINTKLQRSPCCGR